MKKYFFIFLFFLFSCNASMYKFSQYYDKFDNYKKFELDVNSLGQKNSFSSNSSAQLNAQCFIKEGIVSYSLIIKYFAKDWIFIENGESLVMLIDGKRLGFSGKGSINDREVFTDGTIKEIAYYNITKKEFEQIVNGNKIEVKLSGSKYFEEYFFTKGNKIALKIFYDNYVNKTNEEILSIPVKEIKVGAGYYIFTIALVLGLTYLLIQ